MNKSEAAAALNIRPAEVADVEDSPGGPVITTTDGVRYIVVPDDQPDAAGLSGVMLLAAPNDTGSWPMAVYSQPGAGEDTEEDTGEDTEEDTGGSDEPASDQVNPNESGDTALHPATTDPAPADPDAEETAVKGRRNR